MRSEQPFFDPRHPSIDIFCIVIPKRPLTQSAGKKSSAKKKTSSKKKSPAKKK